MNLPLAPQWLELYLKWFPDFLYAANHVTLGGAWQRWFHGGQLAGNSLWGIPILWLGRIGKVSEFIGACVIVIDIIGPHKIREFGKALLAIGSFEKVQAALQNVTTLLQKYFRFESRRELKFNWEDYKRDPLSFWSVPITLICVWTAWHYSPFPWGIKLFPAIVLAYVMQVLVSPVIASLIKIAFLAGIGILAGLIVTLGWILTRKRLKRVIQVLAFLLLVAGFHFDLLSS